MRLSHFLKPFRRVSTKEEPRIRFVANMPDEDLDLIVRQVTYDVERNAWTVFLGERPVLPKLEKAA